MCICTHVCAGETPCRAGTTLKCTSQEVPSESFTIQVEVVTGSGWSAVQFGVKLTAALVQNANSEARFDISLRKVRADCRAEIEAVEARANARIDRLEAQLAQVISAVTTCPQLAGPTVSSGTPLLIHSIEAGLPAAVEYLVEKASDFDPNARFSHPSGLKVSPFLLAVAEGNLDLSLNILSLGADIQDQVECGCWPGETALQLAAASGCLALVEHLVSLGAVISGKCFSVPQGEEGDKISGFLQSRGSSPCTRVPSGGSLCERVMRGLVHPLAVKVGSSLYDAAQHGWDAASFHRDCDDKGGLLFMMKTNDGTVIGAYASGWKSSGSWQVDEKAFLFEVTASGTVKIPLTGNDNQNALYHETEYGPTFGSGHDLRIMSNPHQADCSTNVGSTYSKPSTGFFSCSRSFKLSRLQVFSAQA